MHTINRSIGHLRELGIQATTMEYGSCEQIDAENEFCALAQVYFTAEQLGQWEAWCLKATTAEMVQWALDAVNATITQTHNIFELYRVTLGQASEDLTLRELPVDSDCGRDCAKAIFAGRALMDHAEAAGADSLPIFATVEQIISIYWNG